MPIVKHILADEIGLFVSTRSACRMCARAPT